MKQFLIDWETFKLKFLNNSPIFVYETEDSWEFWTTLEHMLVKSVKAKGSAEDNMFFISELMTDKLNITKVISTDSEEYRNEEEHEEHESNDYDDISEMIASQLKKSDVPDSEFDPEQLARGIEVEKEHTDNEDIAKAIAKAHLSEIPDYYTWLNKMEEEAKKAMGEKNE